MVPYAAVRGYASVVVAAAQLASDGLVAGAYLHGSAVLGGFQPGRSDVDLLLVVDGPLTRTQSARVGRAMVGVSSCPGVGLEASAVTVSAARAPGGPWPFLVHVTTAVANRKLVVGDGHDGDPDLALHYAVARQNGWAVCGPPGYELIGEVPRGVLIERLEAEIAWGLEQSTMAYAVLNAARALRYALGMTICSKLDGGEWAIAAGEPAAVIEPALAEQRGARPSALSAAQKEWVRGVAARVRAARR
ncbi:MAG: aminoglycoside adenylyltransferase domain-containing protein [Mycobacteriales bacterium]